MRYYTETTKEEFLEKVKTIMENDEFPYEVPSLIEKDLEKVNFEWENYTCFGEPEGFGKYPIGYKELKPGFHVYFAAAGGDWELPVCYIFYNSDKGIRAYIPKDGNLWNKKEKCAYGSEDEYDESITAEHLWENEFSEEKLIQDIFNRIIVK